MSINALQVDNAFHAEMRFLWSQEGVMKFTAHHEGVAAAPFFAAAVAWRARLFLVKTSALAVPYPATGIPAL